MAYSPRTPSRPPSRTSSQWYFTKSELANSPSIRDGLKAKDEKTNRSKGVSLIDSVGQKLRLHQITIATAAMFFHRFYMRSPMQRFHHYEVAATCLFLATKVEENPRKLPDLIRETVRFTQRNQELEVDEQSKEYWKWRDTILYTEEQLLEALCFDFDVVHPYDYIVQLVQRFAPGNSTLGKCGWAFINDSHRTVMQILYTPHEIAAAAFYFARKFTQTEIPKGPDGKEWWEQYGVKIEHLRDSVMMMVEVYNTLPHLHYHGKYPSSMVSPPDHHGHKQHSHQNGTVSGDIEMTDAAPSTPADNSQQPADEKMASPNPTPSQNQSPRSTRIKSPSPRERGRSPTRAPRDKDANGPGRYRSSSRGRRSHSRGGRSRSQSQGRHAPRIIDRYVPPAKPRERDTYIPPQRSPRKRPNEGTSPNRGREKRRRSPEDEMSEGEIR